jgi:hypothetical protein
MPFKEERRKTVRKAPKQKKRVPQFSVIVRLTLDIVIVDDQAIEGDIDAEIETILNQMSIRCPPP